MSSLLGFSLFPEITFQRLKLLSKIYHGDFAAAWLHLSAEDLTALRIKPNDAEYILRTKKGFELDLYREKLLRQRIEVIDVFSTAYPAILKEIYDPPILLYKKGPLNLTELQSIAVVGTRKPTAYGCQVTEKILKELQLTPYAIISGLAYGIDTIAHRAALQHKLKTVAVLGTGLDQVYPAVNGRLFQEIAAEGVLLSEYALESKPEKWHFPRRNRIITGLARAVFVIEGDLKSGALVSGKIALEQNRDVYALPGSIFSKASEGPNWLISQGAKPLLDTSSALQEIFSGEQLQFKNLELQKVFLSAPAEKLLEQIPLQADISADDLLEKSALGLAEFMRLLLDLELKGLVAQLPGKRVVRV